MDSPRILVTGATGYIGGSVLSYSINEPALKKAKFFALVRNPAQEALFKPLGIETIALKNADSHEELRELASGFDIIINPAYATKLEHSKALVLGLGDRKKASPDGSVPHIVQTSGTSNLSDRPFTLASRKVQAEFTDLDSANVYETEKELEQEEQYDQRTVELAVIDTGLEVGVKTHVIMSPTIYGPGSGPGNIFSIQIPILIRSLLKNGYAFVVGDGSQQWDHISITDLADLYAKMLIQIVQGKDVPSGKDGIFFSETGRRSWKELAQDIIEAGVKVGRIEKAEVREASLQEAADAYGLGAMPAFVELGFASNSRTKAEKARELGWKSKDGFEEFQKGIEEDWKAVMAKDGN
ncbi:NAD(P)-binding protein [Polyplosphaeria fusca]|uniref:NAD(P)-binding protein n=1 Tax=Polyplosphaeria fusca TaxID=682080 RepID=A0A9P4QTU4_9PLEO|nr:NAD(P)-binding protein [Polyplosphaeria fusca]